MIYEIWRFNVKNRYKNKVNVIFQKYFCFVWKNKIIHIEIYQLIFTYYYYTINKNNYFIIIIEDFNDGGILEFPFYMINFIDYGLSIVLIYE